jgi:hypothetical protein
VFLLFVGIKQKISILYSHKQKIVCGNRVKLGYNDLDGTDKLCSLKLGFVITRKKPYKVTKAKHCKKYVCCKRKFVKTQFVIASFFITKFVITKFVIAKFVIAKFVISKFVIIKFDWIKTYPKLTSILDLWSNRRLHSHPLEKSSLM